MMLQKSPIHRFIELFAKQIPFTPEKIEAITKNKLLKISENEFFIFWQCQSTTLEGIAIEHIDLRTTNGGDHPGFLIVKLSDMCISLGKLRVSHPDIVVTGAPSGRSLEEATVYSTDQSWGKLSFAFTETRPDCLASIIFEPNKLPR